MTNEEENKNHPIENLENQEIDGSTTMGGGAFGNPNLNSIDSTVNPSGFSDPTAAFSGVPDGFNSPDANIINIGTPIMGNENSDPTIDASGLKSDQFFNTDIK